MGKACDTHSMGESGGCAKLLQGVSTLLVFDTDGTGLIFVFIKTLDTIQYWNPSDLYLCLSCRPIGTDSSRSLMYRFFPSHFF